MWDDGGRVAGSFYIPFTSGLLWSENFWLHATWRWGVVSNVKRQHPMSESVLHPHWLARALCDVTRGVVHLSSTPFAIVLYISIYIYGLPQRRTTIGVLLSGASL